MGAKAWETPTQKHSAKGRSIPEGRADTGGKIPSSKPATTLNLEEFKNYSTESNQSNKTQTGSTGKEADSVPHTKC